MNAPSQRTLYRPVGLRELELILDAEARAFPPRLPEQPIFYPVLNEEYAEQIARDWNTPDEASGYSGFVTAFDVDASYLERFEVKVVGASRHQELWVPAEELSTFNARMGSRIRLTQAFYGSRYSGPRPLPTGLKEADPRRQLQVLSRMLAHSHSGFTLEVAANWKTVLINYGFWSACPAQEQGLDDAEAAKVLTALAQLWVLRYPDLPLPRGRLFEPA
jgi:hypothetical protein